MLPKYTLMHPLWLIIQFYSSDGLYCYKMLAKILEKFWRRAPTSHIFHPTFLIVFGWRERLLLVHMGSFWFYYMLNRSEASSAITTDSICALNGALPGGGLRQSVLLYLCNIWIIFFPPFFFKFSFDLASGARLAIFFFFLRPNLHTRFSTRF